MPPRPPSTLLGMPLSVAEATVAPPPLALGHPRFRWYALARLCRERGVASAWQQALAGDPARALAVVEGDFAVGITFADGRTVLAVDRYAIQTLCWRVIDGFRRIGSTDSLTRPRSRKAQTCPEMPQLRSIDPRGDEFVARWREVDQKFLVLRAHRFGRWRHRPDGNAGGG